VIVKVNDVKITKFSELRGQLTAKRPGDFVDITVDRNGRKIAKKVKLGKKSKKIFFCYSWIGIKRFNGERTQKKKAF
jgi:PDZ domain-containing secreted protein